ncbi:MAG: histidine kinase [Desulfuromonas sp.]|uniref:response regulator n=1 Tax=Desulfuromonas sp. TaxID=892 RepID=UPI000CC23299|nr:response regulator [Desulfuromonas sp.]PLX84286.1 MAG: histidine kinase [Desulfuromonas sp.]
MEEPIRILCVDDEKNVLRALERIFLDDDYELLTALSGEDGLEILTREDSIQMVISDYRMPGMNGVDFLREVLRIRPDTVRIVLSGYADTAAVVDAINDGQIYKFIPKPWNDDELKVTIGNGLESYFLKRKNAKLMAELKESNDQLQLMNESLEAMVAKRVSDLAIQNQARTIYQNILDSLPIGVLGIDSGQVIVQCNDRGLELLQEEGYGLVGLFFEDVLPVEINDFIDRMGDTDTLSEAISLNDQNVWIKGAHLMEEDQEGVILVFDEERGNA